MPRRRISSKNYIQLHALFQFALAFYLTITPEVITEDTVIYAANDRVRIDTVSPFSINLNRTSPRSPFAYCGFLLVFFGLFDLTLVIRLPVLNYILSLARSIRAPPNPDPNSNNANNNNNHAAAVKIATEFSSLYNYLVLWLLSVRAWVFLTVASSVYVSADNLWTGRMGLGAITAAMGERDRSMSPVDEFKSRIVLAYGLMEVLFSYWIMHALRHEQRKTETLLRVLSAQVA